MRVSNPVRRTPSAGTSARLDARIPDLDCEGHLRKHGIHGRDVGEFALRSTVIWARFNRSDRALDRPPVKSVTRHYSCSAIACAALSLPIAFGFHFYLADLATKHAT
jgi:hypothetical protein